MLHQVPMGDGGAVEVEHIAAGEIVRRDPVVVPARKRLARGGLIGREALADPLADGVDQLGLELRASQSHLDTSSPRSKTRRPVGDPDPRPVSDLGWWRCGWPRPVVAVRGVSVLRPGAWCAGFVHMRTATFVIATRSGRGGLGWVVRPGVMGTYVRVTSDGN